MDCMLIISNQFYSELQLVQFKKSLECLSAISPYH